jgi:hypothetical protein
MMHQGVKPVVEVERGESFLVAERISRGPTSDLVISWSTEWDAFKLLSECKAIVHAPNRLEQIEIIADDVVGSASTAEELARLVDGCSLVRYNFADWSVVWIRGEHGELSEAQAALGGIPPAMKSMVADSVIGVSKLEVEHFFQALDTH